MQKIAIAFFWAMFLSVLVGMILAVLLNWIGLPWWTWPCLTSGLVVIQAWLQSRDLLAQRLGHRDRPMAQFSGRSIPVSAGGLPMVFESIIPGGRTSNIEVEDVLSVMTATGLLVDGERVKEFVNTAWRRQERGKSGLSRRYWLEGHKPAWDRSEYDALVYVLNQNGFIVGRKDGRSGRLSTDYRSIICLLKRASR